MSPIKAAGGPDVAIRTAEPVKSAAQSNGSFQPMPDLPADQLDALRADIAANGIIVPVVEDQHGRVIDGNHRKTIATELGIDYPVQTVNVADDDDAMDRAVILNCSRRHLTREQVRDIIANEIDRRPDDSDRAIARRVGCSPTTVGAVRAEKRREAEELTAEIRREVDALRERAVIEAWKLHHRERYSWQTVGDVLERMTFGELSKLDSWLADQDVFGPVLGRVFDSIRGLDCDADCTVCTDFDRQWRDEHPHRVYRWSRGGGGR